MMMLKLDAWREVVEKMAKEFPLPPEAYTPGTRVEKSRYEEGDGHELGAQGTVLGAMHHPDMGFAYFIGWDDMPGLGVLTVGSKLKALTNA